MHQVVLLSLASGHDHSSRDHRRDETSSCGGACGCPADRPRVPVLACRDALRAAGAEATTVTARSDTEIDTVLGAPHAPGARVVVAVESVAQLRAVVRRMVRRYAPPPSKRPADLPEDRTLPDLPPIGVLPLAPLGDWLGVPVEPGEVAAAVLAGVTRRLDLLRNDAGSVTLDGALFGGADGAGTAVPFRARVEVDDTVLSEGDEPLLSAVVANATGYADLAGLPLLTGTDPVDGRLDVAVALPTATGRFGRRRASVEVRRVRGRAVAVHPNGAVPFVDDGVAGTLERRRTWWMERGSWAVYTAQDGPVGP